MSRSIKLENAIENYAKTMLQNQIRGFIHKIKTIAVLKNMSSQILQMIVSHEDTAYTKTDFGIYDNLNTVDNFFADVKGQEWSKEHKEYSITDELIISVLSHMHDYVDVDPSYNWKEYDRKCQEGKILVFLTGGLPHI